MFRFKREPKIQTASCPADVWVYGVWPDATGRFLGGDIESATARGFASDFAGVIHHLSRAYSGLEVAFAVRVPAAEDGTPAPGWREMWDDGGSVARLSRMEGGYVRVCPYFEDPNATEQLPA
ncbi:hypothetical protein [Pseudactinotalea sp.]|uniref:hypothetical protein n=1 Tax=Pseudactinotalea sp. TaxID=1926260 RepID=UPI003B3A6D51